MSIQPKMLTDDQIEMVEEACEKVLKSTIFAHATRLRDFLSYVVERTLTGNAGLISQYSLAQDVFARDENFDPAIDAIVRVEAGRLRSKLRDYYTGQGANDKVEIELLRGSYNVGFTFLVEERSNQNSSRQPMAPNSAAKKPVNNSTHADCLDPVIAVLPFVSMSGDIEDEYLADGFTEDLMTDLSKTAELAVIARQSTFVFKHARIGIIEICRELGANYALEGSIRKFANRLRINAQLIDGYSNSHIWAERFDVNFDDIFETQDRINQQIVEALKLNLIESNNPVTPNIEAYDYVLIGLKEARAVTENASEQAKYCYERAIEIDPSYGTAYARLAVNRLWQWIAGYSYDFKNSVELSVDLARTAVKLDKQASLSHSVLCWCLIWAGQHVEGIEAGRKAIEINANDVDAMERLSLGLSMSGQISEAFSLLDNAKKLNPKEDYAFAIGSAHFMAKNYLAAVEALESDHKDRPRFLPTLVLLAACYGLSGNLKTGSNIITKIFEVSPNYKRDHARNIVFKFQDDRDRFNLGLKNLGLI